MISFEDLIRKFSLKKGQACLAVKITKRKQDVGRPIINEEHVKARNSVN